MSKRFDIYGMGNALVDFEIETTVEELSKLGIDKGVMTLIEESRQDELFKVFQKNKHSKACGGSAANTIMGAQSLGANCFYSCKVANDETGNFYKDDLLSKGVESNLLNEALTDGKTGKCLVLITDDADRTMNTFLGITGDINEKQVDHKALGESEYLYVEGYLAGSPVASEAATKVMQFARDNQVKTAFSLSDPNMVNFCRDGLESMIADGVDLLFCNYDEATSYSHTDNLDDAVSHLSQLAETLIITLGADGALIVKNNEKVVIKGHQVTAIDSNGAGDCFAGCFLYGLTNGLTLKQSGELASYASSLLVTQFGPRLNDENLELVKQTLNG